MFCECYVNVEFCECQILSRLCKSMDWFLYDNGLRFERVNIILRVIMWIFKNTIFIEHIMATSS